jgi:hypothetical protein
MVANTNSWINSRIFEGYLSLPDRKTSTKIEKFCCAFIVYCSLKELTESLMHSSEVTESSLFARLLP